MAKKDPLKDIKDRIATAQSAQTALEAGLAQDKQVMDAMVKTMVNENKVELRQSKIAALIADKNSKTHKLTVDFGGGMVAQVSTELINWGVRALGNWSPDSWFGGNVDFMQGLPHFILGLGIYIAEVASRKSGTLPSTTREVISESSKLFAQLGFSNLTRALRVRWGDSKEKDLNMQALQAEKADLEKRLRALQQQVNAK